MILLNKPSYFRETQFLAWISETRSLSVAKIWCRALSEFNHGALVELKDMIQTSFEKLYCEFLLEKNYSITEADFQVPAKPATKTIHPHSRLSKNHYQILEYKLADSEDWKQEPSQPASKNCNSTIGEAGIIDAKTILSEILTEEMILKELEAGITL